MRRLDAIEDWTLATGDVPRFHDEFCTLEVVWFGLEHLYDTVLSSEQTYASHPVSSGEGLPAEAEKAAFLARCAFDWYAVSACNLVSLIGWIAKEAGLTAEGHGKYLRRVLPAVVIHRNKVAAHYSRHSPKSDPEALRVASTMPVVLPVVNGHFVVNAYTLSLRRNGVTSDSSALRSWSVIQAHESLQSRYAVLPAPSS